VDIVPGSSGDSFDQGGAAGDGYRDLLNSGIAGDDDHDTASALMRYHREAGLRPGVWLGSGLRGVAADIETRAAESEEQLRRLATHGKIRQLVNGRGLAGAAPGKRTLPA